MLKTNPFDPVSLPSELAGLTGEIIADLYDIVEKFGTDVPGAAVRRLWAQVPHEIHVSAAVGSNNRNMTAGAIPGLVTVGTAHAFLLKNEPPSAVVWQKGISVADMIRFIAKVDEEMHERGCVDSATGKRTRCPRRHDLPKTRVDDILPAGRNFLALAHDDFAMAELLRQHLDRPDAAEVIASEFGKPLLCRKEVAGVHARAFQIMRHVLQKWSVNSPQDFARLSEEEIKSVVAAMSAALRPVQN